MERQDDTQTTAPAPSCPKCGGPSVRWGRDGGGAQRFRCKACAATFAVRPVRPLGTMRLPTEKAVMVVSLLVEGSSIRSAERVTGVHRDTIMRLLVLVGGKCETLLGSLVRGVKVEHVEADELYSFVGLKPGTARRKGIVDERLGDQWGFLAVERDSKLILAHELGKRDVFSTDAFIAKLDAATTGRFQLSTDGMDKYAERVSYHLVGRGVAYGQIIKTYGVDETEDKRRYSPARIISAERRPIFGNPDRKMICTSYVERLNLDVRMKMRRLTRLTNAFSKKFENLRAAFALFVAHHNFVRIHGSLRCSPAMAAGVVSTLWTVADLIRG